jgi:hypothetical protein
VIAALLLALLPQAEDPVRWRMEVSRPGGPMLTEEATLYAGEVLAVDLVLELDPALTPEMLLSRWRLPLDLALEVQTPWIDGLADAELLPHEEGEGLRVVVDRERGSLAEDQPAADGWRRLRLRRTLVVGEAEAFELATARLAVDYATRFEEDLVRGQVPLDLQELRRETAAFRASVLPLPDGAPPSFRGAVGDFTATLRAEEPTAESWELRIEVRGTGRLDAAMLPRVDGIGVRGQRREVLADGIRLLLEAAPPAGDASPPRIDWSWFDPRDPAGYRTVTLGMDGEGTTIEAETEEPTADEPDEADSLDLRILGAVAGALLLLFLLVRRPWEHEEGPAEDGAPTPAFTKASPRAILQVAPPAPPQDLIQDLAARLGIPRDAVYQAPLASRLQESGVSAGLAEEIAAAVARVTAARFGGQGEAPSPDALDALRARLRDEA